MVFISYSWESEEHIAKVARLVNLLEKSGVEVVWDRKLALGKQIPSFMEDSLQTCRQVLFICTPEYKRKADQRAGGVGYETNVITADVYRGHNDVKYIPVLFAGDWDTSMPVWAGGKLGADLRRDSIEEYEKLLDALGGREAALSEIEAGPEEEIPEEPPEEPAGPEERRALERIYGELLELKEWLVGLRTAAGGRMEDPSHSEAEMWEKVKKIDRMKETYDFLLQESVIKTLKEFSYCWGNFAYIYKNFEKEAAEFAAREAERQTKGWLTRILTAKIDTGEMMRRRYQSLRASCNDALSAIARRLG